VVSSTRYKGDFLDRKIDDQERIYAEEPEGTPKNFLTFRHKQYEVNPRFAEGRLRCYKICYIILDGTIIRGLKKNIFWFFVYNPALSTTFPGS
jgi:hypothetical protein